MSKIKNCEHCGRAFKGRSNARTCSDRCRKGLQRSKGFLEKEAISVFNSAEEAVKSVEKIIVPQSATEEGFVGSTTTPAPANVSPVVATTSPSVVAPVRANPESPPNNVSYNSAPANASTTIPVSVDESSLETSVPQPVLVSTPYIISPTPQGIVSPPPVNGVDDPLEPSTVDSSLDSNKPSLLFSGVGNQVQPAVSVPDNKSVEAEPNPHPQQVSWLFAWKGLVGFAIMVIIVLGVTFGFKGSKQPSSISIGSNKAKSASISNETALGGKAQYTIQLNGKTSVTNGADFIATGTVAIQNEANSTHAFTVQNAAGNTILVADTTNNRVGIGQAPTGSAALQVGGDISATGGISSKGMVLSGSTLAANNGATTLNNSGLTINSVLVCTAAGCKPEGLVFRGDATTLNGQTGGFYTNASNLNSGTLSDGLLSTNVDLLDANQTVSGNKTFTGINSFTAAGNTFTGDGSGLSALDASNISSGTLSDARLSSNVALLNGNNTFTGDNTFNGQSKFNGLTIQNGNFLFQSATNAVGSFQIQNATGNDNLLVADTVNTRIGIGTATPNYTLDVNGDVNVSAGHTFRIDGVNICSNGLCNPSSGSSFYINNTTSAQAGANFNIQSSSASSVGGIIQGASGQTADLLEGKDSGGTTVFALDPQGNVNITGSYEINGSPLCSAGGCTAASGSGNYIQNGIALQASANFNIQSTATGSVVGILQGKSGQTADLLEAKDGNGAVAFSVGSQGAVLSKDTSGGNHTFFQIQGSNFANNLLTADTVTGQILLPNANISSTALLFAGNANLYAPSNNNLKTDNNLTVAGNLTTNGSALFKNTANSTTAFQIQNAGGLNLLTADTTNLKVSTTQLQASSTIGSTSGAANAQLSWNYQASTGLTMSGNEITDATRSAGIQGDGRQPPDSSTGIWEATTNLVTNGGFESNTTNWSVNRAAVISRDTSTSKFGTASLKLVADGTQSNQTVQYNTVSITSGQSYAISFWAKADSARTIVLGYQNGSGEPSTTFNATATWTRFTYTYTAAGSKPDAFFEVGLNGTQAGTLWLDGVQEEQKSIATPYVETNGATDTRNAANMSGPTSLLGGNPNGTFWVAMRFRPETAAAPYIFSWPDQLGGWQNYGYNIRPDVGHGIVYGGQIFQGVSQTASLSVGTPMTVVMAISPGTENLSVNGQSFTTGTMSSITASLISNFVIGSLDEFTSYADGEILWMATGTGTLSSADAATLNNYGNTDPLLSSLTTLNSGAATPTMVWNGVNANYNTTSGTAESQLTLDDVNLYHSASGSVALQGATNSTTAFQVQNATGSSAFNVDTTNGRVGIGTSSPNSKLTIVTTANQDGIRVQTAGTTQPQIVLQDTTNSQIAGFRLAGGSSNLLQIGGGFSGATNNLADIQIGTTVVNGTANPYLDLSASQVSLNAGSAPNKGLVIKGASGQTADLFQLQNSSGNVLAGFDANGKLQFANGTGGAYDTDLYRAGANILQTDGTINAAGMTLNVGTNPANVVLNTNAGAGDTQQRFKLEQSGTMLWGSGSAAQDVQLSRTNAGSLAVQSLTNSATALQVNNSNGGQVLGVDTINQAVNVVNLQASGAISLQNGQGASIQLRTVSNSGTGSKAMTFSGNEITDATRSAGIQGDGRQPPDSSTGIWESTTNLITNGGFESGTSGWVNYANATFAQSTSAAKFGSASLKVTATVAGNADVAGPAAAVTVGQTYTASFWIKQGDAPTNGQIGILWQDSGQNTIASTYSSSAAINNNWQRLTITGTAPTGAVYAKIVDQVGSSGAGGYYYIDGAQLEQKPFATPYVETNGATATRAAARVQAPASVLSSTQGWAAFRVRPSFSSTASGDRELLKWYDDSSHLIAIYWNASNSAWRIDVASTTGSTQVLQSGQSFSAGALITVVAQWTSSGTATVSVNGGTFGGSSFPVGTPSAPTIANALFDIGSAAGTANWFDGDILWTATGTGTLTNTDAASLNNYGNSDPTISSLSSMDSAATPTFAWDGESTQYTGANNAYTNNSQLSIDDVNLTHTGNGSLALQGATNSTTAFQINNASGSTLLNIDSSNSKITANTSALFKNSSNSSAAFQIQDTSGNSMFNIDTTSSVLTANASTVNIGTDSAAHTINIGDTGSGSFPVNSVLDNFNRTNNSSLGAGWSGPILTSHSSAWQVSSNQALDNHSGSGTDNYRTDISSANTEAYFTIQVADDYGVWSRLQNPNTSSVNGYFLEWFGTTLELWKVVNGTVTSLNTVTVPTQTTGNKLGISVVGSNISGYINTGSSWIREMSVSDTSVTGSGTIGISAFTLNDEIDDFGGGATTGNDQSVIAGSTNGASSLLLQAGAGNITLSSASSTIIKPTSDSTTAFQIQNASSSSVFDVDTTNGRVGIGTTTPGQKLDVNGSIRIASGNFVSFGASDSLKIQDAGSNTLNMYTAGTLQTSLDASGNFILSGNGLLVMGVKTSDPTCTNGATYYNSSTNTFRGCANGTWNDFSMGTAVPAGTMQAYAGSTAPTGYFIADGSPVSRTTYAALFAVIGTTYGAGNGSTTFNLPDMRGRDAIGLGTNADVNSLGENDGSALADRTPRHNSTLTLPSITRIADVQLFDPGHSHTYSAPTGSSGGFGGSTSTPSGIGTATTSTDFTGITVSQQPNFSLSGGSVGPGGSRPTDTAAYLTVNYIIKY